MDRFLPCCIFSHIILLPLLATTNIPFPFLMDELSQESVSLLFCQIKWKPSLQWITSIVNDFNLVTVRSIIALELTHSYLPLFLYLVQVVHIENITARNATYVEIPSVLSESTVLALKNIGITRLYSHQVICWFI